MCSTCGCGEGEVHIEGDQHHPHHHAHSHKHGHAHTHEHPHDHSHGHDHQHEHGKAQAQVIHHHYHHNGNVEHHYHYHFHSAEAMQAYLHGQGCCCDSEGHDEGGCCCHGDEGNHEHGGCCCHEDERGHGGAGCCCNHDDDGDGHGHEHDHHHEHFHPKESAKGDLHYGHGAAGTHAPGMTQKRMFEIEMNVLDKNNKIAMHNRDHFDAQNILVLNLVSSPGSGKTTLLTETLMRVKDKVPCAVIEGDQQTSNDADRIRATGVSAIQVNTGKGCHLDAQMVHDAAHRLELKDNSILFIENVGNLVCPAGFDLGERAKVAVLSVTEGEDKPLKYPHMFAAAKLMIINKVDLLPHVKFDVEACIANARRVNPKIEAIQLSATTGEGMEKWVEWLQHELEA